MGAACRHACVHTCARLPGCPVPLDHSDPQLVLAHLGRVWARSQDPTVQQATLAALGNIACDPCLNGSAATTSTTGGATSVAALLLAVCRDWAVEALTLHPTLAHVAVEALRALRYVSAHHVPVGSRGSEGQVLLAPLVPLAVRSLELHVAVPALVSHAVHFFAHIMQRSPNALVAGVLDAAPAVMAACAVHASHPAVLAPCFAFFGELSMVNIASS